MAIAYESEVFLKVLYLVSTLRRTGPTTQLLNITSRVSKNCEVVVITLSPEESDSLASEFTQKGIRVRSIGVSRALGFFVLAKKIKQVIGEESPSIIHTQGVRADSLASQFASDIPCISTVRNFPQLDLLMTYGRLKGKLLELTQVKALRKLARVCGVSAAVAKNLEKQYQLSNVACVRNGVDTNRFRPVTGEQRVKLRYALELPEDGYQFVSSGHLSDRKNPLMLIRAFIKAFGESQNVTLVFVGAGELDAECKRLAEGHNIRFAGRVTNVSDYLAASDCFVSASRAEGMPNAALEAMATGLPVVLSDIPPHKEIFDIDPGVGHLFHLDAEDQLTKSLINIVSDRPDLYAAPLENIIETELSADVMASRYMELYNEMLTEKVQ